MNTETQEINATVSESGKEKGAEEYFFRASAEDFKKIPGSPIAYWVSENVLKLYSNCTLLGSIAEPKQGMATTDNNKYLRLWWETKISSINFSTKNLQEAKLSPHKWFPYNKGGGFRKWFGNFEYIVNWENNGLEIKNDVKKKYPYLNGNVGLVLKLTNPYFHECLTWTATSSSYFGIRYSYGGFLFDVKGSSCFCKKDLMLPLLGFLGSKITSEFLKTLNPTIEFQNGNLKCLPIAKYFFEKKFKDELTLTIDSLIKNSELDWNSYEYSWSFKSNPLIKSSNNTTLYNNYSALNNFRIYLYQHQKELEETNNYHLITAYGLQDELTPEVPLHEITLTCNPHYRYGPGKTEEEYETLQRADTMKELISYAIGCMMGRYSLDEPGLIYAHSGNEGFDPDKYATFPADEDGIVPVNDMDWFEDDASKRFEEFLSVTWPRETLEENLQFVADSLKPNKNETPRETIRRFISTKFFKEHHLKVYKKRPIYWLFSSGRHRAFECLVYLHRYNETTLPRMRSAYVTPLQGKLNARIDYLEQEVEAATSASGRKALEKDLKKMRDKQQELRVFDELLRHYADQRITLDLDDGVKVNYGKFGKLLAEVNGVTGKKAE